jgi:hypothetical protein
MADEDKEKAEKVAAAKKRVCGSFEDVSICDVVVTLRLEDTLAWPSLRTYYITIAN